MRITLLSAVIAAGSLVGIPLAYGQGTNLDPGDNGASTTCPQFLAMDESAQIELLGLVHSGEGATAEAAGTANAAAAPAAAAGDNATAQTATPTADATADGETELQEESQLQAVRDACGDDDKLTIGQALDQIKIAQ